MKILSSLTKHYKDDTYDRVSNPARRPVVDLLPIAISWVFDNQKKRIDFATSGLACALSDMTGIAVVDAIFAAGTSNKAYIVDADGSERFVVSKPEKCAATDFFSDVYYVGDVLNFFVSGRSGDCRIEYDANVGEMLRIIETR
jgi:hypothetical protein